ncbi:hypothetical protein PRZ48_006734 [Zasmidium cellare]|uniref:Carboxylesterase type B domain-containing protein n=1 Tax=Zasmidium cellare TaxID=395010 RepID=A0ABR0EPX9_ZASCE|nr:hypothetical protein PRZ48_006734 [Zasmidium cellare]
MPSTYGLVLAIGSLTASLASAKPVLRATSNNTALVDLGYASYAGYSTSSGINNFLGMRYAAPPLGERRFQLPQTPLRETGVVNATQHGAVCFGVTNPATPAPPLDYAEDCLFIDVYAPANATSTSNGLPVMLWIQGGGYVQDYNPNYNGTGLIEASEGNLIVVSFNYRVGPYGFLASNDLKAEGNLNAGFHDQLAAIQWVQDHISAFGGDPTQVTLFGTSVGGGSVVLHNLAYGGSPPSNVSTPTWSAGIGESIYLPSVLTVDQAQFQYDHLLAATNCSNLSCLRAVPSSLLQESNVAIPFPGQQETALFGYSPVIDGTVFPDRPSKLLASGRFFKDRPLIMGSSESDGTIFTPQVNTTGEAYQFLKAQLPGLTNTSFDELNRVYEDTPVTYPGVNKTQAPLYYRTATIYSDLMFLCPALTFAGGFNNAGVPVHMFLDRIQDPVEVAAGYLTPHTWELQAVWGSSFSTNYVALPNANSYDAGKSNNRIVSWIQAYWTSFATSFGNPNTLRLKQSPNWLEVGDGHFLSLRTNSTRMEKMSDDMAAKCALWASLVDETYQ